MLFSGINSIILTDWCIGLLYANFRRNCLVAIGLYDGNVAILNLEKDEENETRTQVLKNIPTVMKHRYGADWGRP
jgi:hypothetical protein